MTSTVLIAICLILLLAYVFDISASRTRIPAVILLLSMGWLLQQLASWTGTDLPDLAPILPVLGTIGLILIVLEGSLELELSMSKIKGIGKAFILSLLPLVGYALLMAWLVSSFGGESFLVALTNAIPLAIISSAIAIPAASALQPAEREFVIYESSFSDILGVLVFNFVSLNEEFGLPQIGGFGLQLLAILALSLVATIGLALLLGRIRHKIKFAPIILFVILIYAVAKIWHLPGLILILAFGMFLANVNQLARWHWLTGRMQFYYNAAITRLRVDVLHQEVHRLGELVSEAAFLIRSLFFILFGFQIQAAELLNAEALKWSIIAIVLIYALRWGMLKAVSLPARPFLFIAPRGLITLLLYLSIPGDRLSNLLSRSVILQVIIGSALIMAAGGIFFRSKEKSGMARETDAPVS